MIDNFLVKINFLAVKIDLFDAKSLTNNHLQVSHPAKPGYSGWLMRRTAAKRSRREAATTGAATTPNPGFYQFFG